VTKDRGQTGKEKKGGSQKKGKKTKSERMEKYLKSCHMNYFTESNEWTVLKDKFHIQY
jgi:hypothetical protein